MHENLKLRGGRDDEPTRGGDEDNPTDAELAAAHGNPDLIPSHPVSIAAEDVNAITNFDALKVTAPLADDPIVDALPEGATPMSGAQRLKQLRAFSKGQELRGAQLNASRIIGITISVAEISAWLKGEAPCPRVLPESAEVLGLYANADANDPADRTVRLIVRDASYQAVATNAGIPDTTLPKTAYAANGEAIYLPG